MTKVLITGANGMLGQDLSPIFEDEGFEVIETDVHNLDVTNEQNVEEVFSAEKPNIVIHCAAYTNVDKAEEDIETARLINAVGTKNIAEACKKFDAVMVYISTDYVFDGKGSEPYKSSDKTAPLNHYGLTKWEGEEAVRKHLEKYYICRTSWLYGIHGKNFVETMLSLADKPDVKVINDQIGCPTWTVELANGIVNLIEDDAAYGTYHVCGSGQASWYEFAMEIFKNAGIKVSIQSCTTDEFSHAAKRPAYSVMDNDRMCRDWKVALKDYMALRPVEICV